MIACCSCKLLMAVVSADQSRDQYGPAVAIKKAVFCVSPDAQNGFFMEGKGHGW